MKRQNNSLTHNSFTKTHILCTGWTTSCLTNNGPWLCLATSVFQNKDRCKKKAWIWIIWSKVRLQPIRWKTLIYVYALQKSLFNCSSCQCIWDWSFPLTHYTLEQVLTSQTRLLRATSLPHLLTPQVSSYQSYTILATIWWISKSKSILLRQWCSC